jgi:hypothetical protein
VLLLQITATLQAKSARACMPAPLPLRAGQTSFSFFTQNKYPFFSLFQALAHHPTATPPLPLYVASFILLNFNSCYPDLIVLCQGSPLSWLFTGSSGRIMIKAQPSLSHDVIHKSFTRSTSTLHNTEGCVAIIRQAFMPTSS